MTLEGTNLGHGRATSNEPISPIETINQFQFYIPNVTLDLSTSALCN